MKGPRCWARGPLACPHPRCPAGQLCDDIMTHTCMLQDVHAGPHLWTPDDQIVFTTVPPAGKRVSQ